MQDSVAALGYLGRTIVLRPATHLRRLGSLTKLLWPTPGEVAKHPAEVFLIVKADLMRNRIDTVIGIAQQLLRLVDPVSIEVLPRRQAELAVEDTAEVIFARADFLSKFPTRNLAGVILVQIGDCALD